MRALGGEAVRAVSAVRAQCVWWGGRVARVVVLGQQWNTILLLYLLEELPYF